MVQNNIGIQCKSFTKKGGRENKKKENAGCTSDLN